VNALDLRGVTIPARISNLDLEVEPGMVVGLVGPNGSGKSTLLQAAAGLLVGTGTVAWSGRSIADIPHLERGRMTTWVPQETRFEFAFTVRSVVAQGRFAHGDDGVGVDTALARLDLTRLADRPVDRLSGGERQRVLLARALATDARLHLWDEPLAPLDPRHALKLLAIARELAGMGKTLLFSLHDLRVAHQVDRVAVMQDGHLRAFGVPDQVLTPSLLREVFGVVGHTAPGQVFSLP
jgi:iron complex transport system ATP-binding protein